MSVSEACRVAIEACRLESPVVCEPFVIRFDARKLGEVRDVFGYGTYLEALGTIVEEDAE